MNIRDEHVASESSAVLIRWLYSYKQVLCLIRPKPSLTNATFLLGFLLLLGSFSNACILLSALSLVCSSASAL